MQRAYFLGAEGLHHRCAAEDASIKGTNCLVRDMWVNQPMLLCSLGQTCSGDRSLALFAAASVPRNGQQALNNGQ